MHFSLFLFATLGCIASAVAQSNIAFTAWPSSITAGQPVTLTWNGATDAPVTITLRKGPSGDLKDVQVLTNTAQGGTYTFTPAASLVNGDDYAFQIEQEGTVNYSGLIALQGGATAGPESTIFSTMTVSDVASTASPTTGTTTLPDAPAPTTGATTSATTLDNGHTSTSQTKPTTTVPSGRIHENLDKTSFVSSSAVAQSTSIFEGAASNATVSGSASIQTTPTFWLVGVMAFLGYLN
ncbi:hypothetical protein ASPZODRAFT_67032 [Penicilliopsis zonata CBS 506.65]|uniref:Yeast cell wall synthesis Kre9/Knh1-like N-terminal domain-containing protein n=1 Tax=Penicilliopsis zonata CBS 506.65 TaxID=1073090 RepID=A0A1L9SG21_9EURO|nr:hypothetical protein ASPZODRAFT_67032 [Penicilliopsis zonata CBS 506.65]OJJ46116.1 hypothetical protein ASPZODRAFT_67032 [Penicilliopsis zonata CBS 506.65]